MAMTPRRATKTRPPRGRRPRLRALTLVAVTVLSLTAALIAAVALAERHSHRYDVTSAGEQQLAPRTRNVLDRVADDFRIVIAADLRTIDRRARERVTDVVDEMRRAQGRIGYASIDTGSVSGMASYKAFLKDLVQRDEGLIRDQTAAIGLAAGAATSLSGFLTDSLSPALLRVREQTAPSGEIGQTNRAYFEQSAAAARLAARDLAAASGRAGDALKTRLGDIPLPSTDRAAAALVETIAPVIDQLAALARELRRFTEAEATAGPGAEEAKPLIAAVEQRRDQASVVLDSLRRMKRLDLLRIVDVLRSGSAALVIGPPGVGINAIDLAALFPRGSALENGVGGSDLSRRAEELLSTSIAALINPSRPIVVVVHGEPRAYFDQIPMFERLSARLRLRGIDLVEWAAVADQAPPKLATIDPDGSRPVVYVSMAPDSTAQGVTRGAPAGAQRAARLGQVLTSLADSGANLLVSMNPSIIPGYGEQDPTTAPLARFGLAAETGRPLLRERVTAQGRVIETDQMLMPDRGDTPLAGAVRNLPTFVPWPIALFERPVEEKVRITRTTLYSIQATADVWAESQWLRLWQTPREQRSILPEGPQFDEGRDGRWPEGQPTKTPQRWAVSVAAERFELGAKPQRLIAVGSNAWFMDQVTHQQLAVDGRAAAANPGNLELFEAAVYWLANQDALIAQSPSARIVPMIGNIDETLLSRLRLAVVIGMPMLVLLAGLSYRLVRG